MAARGALWQAAKGCVGHNTAWGAGSSAIASPVDAMGFCASRGGFAGETARRCAATEATGVSDAPSSSGRVAGEPPGRKPRKMDPLRGLRFENPCAVLKKQIPGPFVLRATLRGENFMGHKGSKRLRERGLLPAVVTNVFGKGEHTPIAVDAPHFTRLHRYFGLGLFALPMRLSFAGIEIPGFEGRPFAPQVITHDIDTVPISQRDGNLVAPSAVGFKFAPANQPVIASVPVVLVGQEENEGFKKGRAWEVEIRSVRVKADRPDLLPRSVTIDVKNDGEQGIHRLSDVAALLPQGVRLYRHNDPRLTVARVVWRKQFNGALEYKGNPKKGGEGAEA